MKHLFNYCLVPGYEREILKSGKTLNQFLQNFGLDGIELMVYRYAPNEESQAMATVGVHLNYWPMWLDLYNEDYESLSRFFTSGDSLRDYYGSTCYDGWLRAIRDNIRAGLKESPQYLVWHVAECSTEEVFTFKFEHTDKEVVKAAAALFNAVADEIPDDTLVLFENLWWPGLKLTDPAVVDLFFSLLRKSNVGIILDTGHLMNTNPQLQSEAEGIEYICKTVRALGDNRKLIYGLHLNCSLSGEYQCSFERRYDAEESSLNRYRHIGRIDQHRPFTVPQVQKILELVEPDYVVHELAYKDFKELEHKLATQLTACGKKVLQSVK